MKKNAMKRLNGLRDRERETDRQTDRSNWSIWFLSFTMKKPDRPIIYLSETDILLTSIITECTYSFLEQNCYHANKKYVE